MAEPLLSRHPNGQAATSKNEIKSVLGGRRTSASLQALFPDPNVVIAMCGRTLWINAVWWPKRPHKLVSRTGPNDLGLNKEALDQSLGIADGRVNNPEALHRGKKRFVGPDAPLKEQLG